MKNLCITIEAVQALLEAGSSMEGETHHRPLEVLLNCNSCFWSDKIRRLTATSCITVKEDSLVNEQLLHLIQLLLKAEPDLVTYGEDLLDDILDIAIEVVIGYIMEPKTCNEPENKLMNSLADMFRIILFAGTSRNDDETLKCIHTNPIWILEPLSFIAYYASRSGNSKKLMQILLDSFSSTQLNKLKSKLVDKELLRQTELRCQYSPSSDDMVKWINEVETPRSLKHMSRESVVRAMSHRIVDGVPTLGLPKTLQEYVQYY